MPHENPDCAGYAGHLSLRSRIAIRQATLACPAATECFKQNIGELIAMVERRCPSPDEVEEALELIACLVKWFPEEFDCPPDELQEFLS